jgi:hypothetical protein
MTSYTKFISMIYFSKMFDKSPSTLAENKYLLSGMEIHNVESLNKYNHMWAQFH